MHDTFTPDEQSEILRMAGIKPEHVAEFTTPAPVIEAVVTEVVAEQQPIASEDAIEKIAKELLAKARGNYDTAKQASDKWAQTEFDKVKLSKIQAAALGVDKSKHNKDEYKRIQAEKEKINSAMRKLAKGHVATKIAAKKEQASAGNPELDAFLLKYQGNPLAAELAQLLNK
jgi:hypothetical protein